MDVNESLSPTTIIPAREPGWQTAEGQKRHRAVVVVAAAAVAFAVEPRVGVAQPWEASARVAAALNWPALESWACLQEEKMVVEVVVVCVEGGSGDNDNDDDDPRQLPCGGS